MDRAVPNWHMPPVCTNLPQHPYGWAGDRQGGSLSTARLSHRAAQLFDPAGIFDTQVFKKRPGILVNRKPVFVNGGNYHIWFQQNTQFPEGAWLIKGGDGRWGSSPRICLRPPDWLPSQGDYIGAKSIEAFVKEINSGINEFMIILASEWRHILVNVQINPMNKLDIDFGLSIAKEGTEHDAVAKSYNKLKEKVSDGTATYRETQGLVDALSAPQFSRYGAGQRERKLRAVCDCPIITKDGKLVTLSEDDEVEEIGRTNDKWIVVRTETGKIGQSPSVYFRESNTGGGTRFPKSKRGRKSNKSNKSKKSKKSNKSKKSKRGRKSKKSKRRKNKRRRR